MADAQTENPPSLSQQCALKEKEEKSDVAPKPAEEKEVENPVNAASGSGDVVNEKLEEAPAPASVEGSTEAPPAAEESSEANPAAGDSGEGAAADAEESSEPAAEENSGDAEETPEIKLETAPADFRFPTTNQTRHCFTRYIEYHRCVAAKGEGAPECDKFAKYYRALCPGEWIDRWNEQRENGTFPGWKSGTLFYFFSCSTGAVLNSGRKFNSLLTGPFDTKSRTNKQTPWNNPFLRALHQNNY
ncbi:hypothetical protein V6N13_075803 [Hibiscus sabdariffa]